VGEAAAAGGSEVEEYFAIMLPRLVGLERHADGMTPGRAVRDVEAPVMLRAFDELALDQPSARWVLAWVQIAVGGVQLAVGGAVNGVSLLVMIEADDVFLLQEVLTHTSIQPFTGRPLAVKTCAVAGASERMVGVGSLRLTPIPGVFPGGGRRAGARAMPPSAGVGGRHVRLHQFMQPGEVVIRHQREHVVLDVVVHVPVEVAMMGFMYIVRQLSRWSSTFPRGRHAGVLP